jgi:hypothetical protein
MPDAEVIDGKKVRKPKKTRPKSNRPKNSSPSKNLESSSSKVGRPDPSKTKKSDDTNKKRRSNRKEKTKKNKPKEGTLTKTIESLKGSVPKSLRKKKKGKDEGSSTNTRAHSSSVLDTPKDIVFTTSIAEYVEKSTIHYDKKQVVKYWIASNPTSVAALTPADLSLVLSNISFALEHPAVITLLTQAILENGGSVTTEHILAAMRASPIQDFLIAEAMAPFVVDPQNKGVVLDSLHMTFDKERILQCFRPSIKQTAV